MEMKRSGTMERRPVRGDSIGERLCPPFGLGELVAVKGSSWEGKMTGIGWLLGLRWGRLVRVASGGGACVVGWERRGKSEGQPQSGRRRVERLVWKEGGLCAGLLVLGDHSGDGMRVAANGWGRRKWDGEGAATVVGSLWGAERGEGRWVLVSRWERGRRRRKKSKGG